MRKERDKEATSSEQYRDLYGQGGIEASSGCCLAMVVEQVPDQ